jgi:hypothetical protein
MAILVCRGLGIGIGVRRFLVAAYRSVGTVACAAPRVDQPREGGYIRGRKWAPVAPITRPHISTAMDPNPQSLQKPEGIIAKAMGIALWRKYWKSF